MYNDLPTSDSKKMFYAERRTSGGLLTIHLFGVIDDGADLMAVIGNTPMKVIFNTREVTNINSSGIGHWLKYVEPLHAAGVKVTYSECSAAFVGCLTFATSARYGAKVASVFAPFRCPKCKANWEVLIKTPDVFAIKPQLNSQVCKKCHGPLQFDEISEEYFSFLG